MYGRIEEGRDADGVPIMRVREDWMVKMMFSTAAR